MSRQRQASSASGSARAQKASGRPTASTTSTPPAMLVAWDELAAWQRDNRYIRAGYRRASHSLRQSLLSLRYMHNESVNIYSHLIGALLFPVASLRLYYGPLGARYGTASTADVLAFGCFFAGVTSCLAMSATYHAISNHSPAVARLGNQLDYGGIVVLIWSSFVANVSYAFYAAPWLRNVYWSMVRRGLACSTYQNTSYRAARPAEQISVLAVAGASVSVLTRFRTPPWRPVRAAIFVAIGLSAVLPVLHGARLYGWTQLRRQVGLDWLLLQGLLYILGATIYAARVPERLRPGMFDIWGASHQIFHVLVLLAAMAHLKALVRAFDYHHTQRMVE
ncbi:MAG: hypothetical protein M1826_004818 [Phylliscum demangeonii]|nr:MAG: hypothetical protein M1826_004818 [Phylliscum demangeonii]